MGFYSVDATEVYYQSLVTTIFFLLVFMIIVMWKIFKKTGNKGWKCLVPIYSNIVEFKFLGISLWMMVLVILSNIVLWIGKSQDGYSSIWTTVSLLISLPTSILVSKKLAEKFGKSEGFAFGLFFLPIIFYPILAFGKAKYKQKTL